MMLNITRQDEGDIVIMVLEGRVDSDGASVLENTLRQVVAQQSYRIILEMSRVSYMNSAGLRSLADTLTECREHNGDLRIVAITAKVRRVFEIIGFNRFFPDYGSVLGAMDGW